LAGGLVRCGSASSSGLALGLPGSVGQCLPRRPGGAAVPQWGPRLLRLVNGSSAPGRRGRSCRPGVQSSRSWRAVAASLMFDSLPCIAGLLLPLPVGAGPPSRLTCPALGASMASALVAVLLPRRAQVERPSCRRDVAGWAPVATPSSVPEPHGHLWLRRSVLTNRFSGRSARRAAGPHSLGGPAAPALPRWPVVSCLVWRVVVVGGPTAELQPLGDCRVQFP
jgi:hypothetical protein